MKHFISLDTWKLALLPHSEVTAKAFAPTLPGDFADSGALLLDATVPGNFECDLQKAGLLPNDLAYGTNILSVQAYERHHLWYFTTFSYRRPGKAAPFLVFDGIDTVAEIFLDGALLGKTDNMFIAHEFPLDNLAGGEHSLVVHIIPPSVATMDAELPVAAHGLLYNMDSLLLRKAPYMFGWDIMSRVVSGGLWRPVRIEFRPPTRITDFCLMTRDLSEAEATLFFRGSVHTDLDDLRSLILSVEGKCGDSVFSYRAPLYSTHLWGNFSVANPKIWNVAGRGEQNLYDCTASLILNGKILDSISFRHGVRTVRLDRTSLEGEDGKFDFLVNGKRVFLRGTNLVPTDMFPSRYESLVEREMKLVAECNCNAVRIWGGSIYPPDSLLDFCDEHGILIWQDFMLACGFYPQDGKFADKLYREAVAVIKRLRSHPSLALWSGDNECDMSMCTYGRFDGDEGIPADPNLNVLTRTSIRDAVRLYDPTRSYLPSSPYMDEEAFLRRTEGKKPSESHYWGRNFFKSDYYRRNWTAPFSSEIGYHGCPSPASLREMISPEHLPFRGDSVDCNDPEWLVHSAAPCADGGHYRYRIPAMTRQVCYLFGADANDCPLAEYALKSQIYQAEALKYYVERFRAEKSYRGGILWWNVIDGWFHISDAVVDHHGRKKLAYSYLTRSQKPFALVTNDPHGDTGSLTLVAVNDYPDEKHISYQVTNALTGASLCEGSATVRGDEALELGELPASAAHFIHIEWSGDETGENHAVTGLSKGLSYADYLAFLKTTNYITALEGFENEEL